ncbi:MAG: metallophosphoesterase [Armatimonadota bacterium]
MKSVKILFAIVMCLLLATGAWATDFTIFFASEMHYPGGMITDRSRAGVQAMNNLPGMAWPYGTVPTPSAFIACGDLADGGAWGTTYASDAPQWYTNRNYTHQWNGFDYNFPLYGVQGDNNRLRYPRYAVPGNHDWWRWCGYTLGTSQWVATKLKAQYGNCNSTNGNVYYSFNIDGIHFAALGRYPDSYVLSWLANDLAGVGTDTPVILFMHYALNDDEEWWSYAQRQLLANAIAGYNVIAILHGHTHSTTHYTWNGYDVYDDGALTEYGGVNVMHITDTTIDTAHYSANVDGNGNWSGGGWLWSYQKTY